MNTDLGIGGGTEAADWWAAAAVSEDPAYLADFWFPRAEEKVTFGSKWFDADLNPLDRASGVALEVRLIRAPEEAVCRARFEVRTNLALFTDGSNLAKIQQLVKTIAAAQRELAERAGVSFAAPSAAKPHVLTSGPRGLLRAYGSRGSGLQGRGVLSRVVDRDRVSVEASPISDRNRPFPLPRAMGPSKTFGPLSVLRA